MRMPLALLVVSLTAACAPCCEESDAERVVAGVGVGDHLSDVTSKLGQPDRTACRGDEWLRTVEPEGSKVPQASLDRIDRGLVYLRRWPFNFVGAGVVVFLDRDHRVVWIESLGSGIVQFGTPAPWMPADGDCRQRPQVVDGPTLAPDCASKGGKPVERVLSREPLRSALLLWREIFSIREKNGDAARAELGALYCREGYLEAGRLLIAPASARYRAVWPGGADTVWVDRLSESTTGAERPVLLDSVREAGWEAVAAEILLPFQAGQQERTLQRVEAWLEGQSSSTTGACRWSYAALQVAIWNRSGLSAHDWEAMYRVAMTCLVETSILAPYPGRLDGYLDLSSALARQKQRRLEAGVWYRALDEPAERVVAPTDRPPTREWLLDLTRSFYGESVPVPQREADREPVVDEKPLD